jgi:carboxylesterase type B
MWTDGWFIGFTEALKQRFSYGAKGNTFVYRYSHKGSASYSVTSRFYGTSHVDDLIPFFGMNKNIFISSIPTQEDRELERVLPELWINFAKTG